MITTCTECQARYQLDATKIPPRMIKVRCPACGGVFSLDGSQAQKETPEVQDQPLAVQEGYDEYTQPAAAETPVAQEPVAQDPVAQEPVAEEPVASETPPADEPVTSPATATVEPQAASSAPSAHAGEPAAEVAVMDRPVERSSRRRRSKEEMLARALVSDIMVYNRDLYDQAKADGNLLEALGAEIKKSWELYKEKVTPEVANSNNHFRDALNEILADGENIF
ncbi:MAG: zinc-ribbon domain-containing protein [Candidatus Krumholzibacteriota bacterium]